MWSTSNVVRCGGQPGTGPNVVKCVTPVKSFPWPNLEIKEPLLLGPRVNQNQYFILQIKNIYIGVAKDVASERFEVGWACP